MPPKIKNWIEKCQEKFGLDRFDYSKTNYHKAIEKVIIRCILHDCVFEQIAFSHFKGCIGCPECKVGRTLTTIEFIKRAKKYHGDQYDYSQSIYISAKTPIKIICKKHGRFEQKPTGHLSGRGCYACGIKKLSEKITLTTDEFIKRAKIIHGDLYDYSKTKYIGGYKEVIIICKVHGEFLQSPCNHLQNHKCAKCFGYHKTTEDIISEYKLIHGNKYDYSDVVYSGAQNYVKIICKIHGIFETTSSNHLKGSGCRKCCDANTSIRLLSNTQEFIEKSQKVHGNRYDYFKVNYIKSSLPVIIICKDHGEFNQTPETHLRGSKCCFCSRIRISKSQLEWLNFIKNNEPDLQYYSQGGEYKIPNTNYRVDGFVSTGLYGTIYEFHGDFWHGNPKIFDPNKINPINKKTYGELFKETLHKEMKLRQMGYKYICIWESDWNRLKKNIDRQPIIKKIKLI